MNKAYANRMEKVRPSAVGELLMLGAQPDIISFGGGYPAPEVFPVDKLSSVFADVMSQSGPRALQYSTPEGLLSLREKLVLRMKQSGISCDLDNLFIIQGGQQGLDLVAKMFINEGDVIVTESPTFMGALIAFNPYEPVYKTVPMDEHGMDMDALEEILRTNARVKFIYTVPEFQNPTGVTMSLERRQRLVELANQYDVMILEDSPYREIRFQGELISPIKSFDTEGRVIHLGSFSKILSPGLRLGWVVAETEIATKLCLLKMAADTQNSTLNMYLADKFMEKYNMDEHIQSIRVLYKEKKETMIEAVRQYLPSTVSYTNPEGGLFTWLTFPQHVDATTLMRDRLLPEAKVAYVPGSTFFPVDEEVNHCRMNYSGASKENIIKGVAALGTILKEYC
ncbi:aminotransferase-like domain-containing protein [Alicyclobacillus mengziensis]|uniref:PLP-dependent aminotransferase family protein n=1 Tax=Alicyclobacillus mengziensis TaxID=2931921 RepID=A0A9X7VWV8_9BACL|nr:PLP-dependent aminotransferase family protein [Alicyclobacillus mengziensis]QSO46524.1 PLP-dependent aminotransferase family protein [Alicyclobacillus mengziensis]